MGQNPGLQPAVPEIPGQGSGSAFRDGASHREHLQRHCTHGGLVQYGVLRNEGGIGRSDKSLGAGAGTEI
jgi:hypothetical protein